MHRDMKAQALDALAQQANGAAWALFDEQLALVQCSQELALRWRLSQEAWRNVQGLCLSDLHEPDASALRALLERARRAQPVAAVAASAVAGPQTWQALALGCAEHAPLPVLLTLAVTGAPAGQAAPQLPWQPVLDSLHAFVAVLTPQGQVCYLNRAPLEAGGTQLAAVCGQSFWDTVWWSHESAQQAWLRQAVQRCEQGEMVRDDVAVRMREDTRMTLDFMMAPLRDAAGSVTHLVVCATDVTDRKVGEQLLRTSMARFRSIFQAAPQGIALVDAQGRIALANPACCALFGWNLKDLVGNPISRLLKDAQDEAQDGHAGAFLRGPIVRAMALQHRVQGLHADGRVLELDVGVDPVPDVDPPQLLVTLVDISERDRLQRVLEQGLKEKTVLLNEVHHRVKNNLQVIASLLRLQSRYADAASATVLQGSIDRVKAMALTHQLLYESSGFSALEVGHFLARLTALLRESHAQSRDRVRLEVIRPAEPIYVSLEQAVPCGLLVNELVTNAFKHAFPDAREGCIWVEAARSGPQRLRVRVQDDGIGLQPDCELGRDESLGFQLIPALCEQMNARICRTLGPGTGFEIELEVEGASA